MTTANLLAYGAVASVYFVNSIDRLRIDRDNVARFDELRTCEEIGRA